MRKGTKRMLSVLMIAALAVSMNPQRDVGNQIAYAQEEGTVATAEELQQLIAGCNQNQTAGNAVLSGDITLDSALILNSGTLSLDLNGHSLSGALSEALIQVKGGTLDINDSSGNGSISNTSAEAFSLSGGILNVLGGEFRGNRKCLSVSGGTANLSGGSFSGSADCVLSTGGTLNLSGGTFEGPNTCIDITGTECNITGGTYTSKGSGTNGCGLRIKNQNQVSISGEDTKIVSDYGCIFLSSEFSGNTLSISGGLFQTVTTANNGFGYPCYLEGGCDVTITGGTFQNEYSSRSLVLGENPQVELKGGSFNKGIAKGVSDSDKKNYTAFYGTTGVLGEGFVLTDNEVFLEGNLVHIKKPVEIVEGFLLGFDTRCSSLEDGSSVSADLYSLTPVSVGKDGKIYGNTNLTPQTDSDKITNGNQYTFHGWQDETGTEYPSIDAYLTQGGNKTDTTLKALWDAKTGTEDGFAAALMNEKAVKSIELTKDISLKETIFLELDESAGKLERTLDFGGKTLSYQSDSELNEPALTLAGVWNLKNGSITGENAPCLKVLGTAVLEDVNGISKGAPYALDLNGGTSSKILSGSFETTLETGYAIKISGGSETDGKNLLKNTSAGDMEWVQSGSDTYLNAQKVTVSKAAPTYIEQGEELALGSMTYKDAKISQETLSNAEYTGDITITGIRVDSSDFVVEGEAFPKTLKGESTDTYAYMVSAKDSLAVGSYQATIEIFYVKQDGREGTYKRTVSLSVLPKQLGITMPDVTMSKGYDGSRNADVVPGTLIGLAQGDQVRVTATASYEDADAGSGKRITVRYLLSGDDKGNYLAPESELFTGGVIFKAKGEASVLMEDYYVGESPSPVAKSDTNGTGNVSWYYKQKDAPESAYQTQAPTEEGSYMLKAVFGETKNYLEVIVTKEFQVSYLAVPKQPYTLEGSKGEDGWYVSKVTIYPAEGFLLSTEAEGDFKESYDVYSTQEPVIYLKSAGGAVTKPIPVEKIQIDTKAPEITGIEDGALYYEDEVKAVFQDENLSYVLLNGEKITVTGETYTLSLKPAEERYTLVAKDKAGNKAECRITVEEAWMKEGIVSNGVKMLKKAKAYKLGSGQWTVSGDPTVYYGGTIYVNNSGEYDFTKQ